MLARFFWLLIDFVIPPRCLVCQVVVTRPGYVCGGCWSTFFFITHPACSQCGLPQEIEIDQNALCGGCLQKPPIFQKARSALVYDDVSKPLILKLKHGDGTYLAPAFVEWMHHAGIDLCTSVDYLIPVPLHWQRLITRRYNQAALLANGLSKKWGVPVLLTALKRVKKTASQGHLSSQEREDNMKNAFVVDKRYKALLQGKTVALIDDVLTSGATVNACTKTLLNHGASSVFVLTLARTVRHRH